MLISWVCVLGQEIFWLRASPCSQNWISVSSLCHIWCLNFLCFKDSWWDYSKNSSWNSVHKFCFWKENGFILSYVFFVSQRVSPRCPSTLPQELYVFYKAGLLKWVSLIYWYIQNLPVTKAYHLNISCLKLPLPLLSFRKVLSIFPLKLKKTNEYEKSFKKVQKCPVQNQKCTYSFINLFHFPTFQGF